MATDRSKRGRNLEFRAIVGTRKDLFGIDTRGKVWKYVPKREASPGSADQFAFWTRITSWTPIEEAEEPK